MQENNDLLFSSFDIAYNTPEIYKIRNVQQILKCLTLKYTTIQCIHNTLKSVTDKELWFIQS